MYKFKLTEDTESTKFKLLDWYQVPDETYFEKHYDHYYLTEKGKLYFNLLPAAKYVLSDIFAYDYNSTFDIVRYNFLNKLHDMTEYAAVIYLSVIPACDLINEIVYDNPTFDIDVVTEILKKLSDSTLSYYNNKKVDVDELDNMLNSGDFIENTENDFYN